MSDFHPIDLAYAAGIVDGEGTILIAELKPNYESNNRRRHRKNTRHKLSMAVVMTDPTIPLLMQQMFGGSVGTYDYGNPKHSPHTRWTISGPKAAECCKLILPYLRLKRLQAELAIEFQKRIVPHRFFELPPDELAERRNLTERMRGLNQKGRSALREVV